MTLNQLLATAEYQPLSNADAAALVNTPRHAALRESRQNYISLAGQPTVGPDVVRRLISAVESVVNSDKLVNESRHWLRSSTGIDVGHPATRALIDAMPTPLTTSDKTKIKALAEYQQSDADLHELGLIEEKHIRWAREGII